MSFETDLKQAAIEAAKALKHDAENTVVFDKGTVAGAARGAVPDHFTDLINLVVTDWTFIDKTRDLIGDYRTLSADEFEATNTVGTLRALVDLQHDQFLQSADGMPKLKFARIQSVFDTVKMLFVDDPDGTPIDPITLLSVIKATALSSLFAHSEPLGYLLQCRGITYNQLLMSGKTDLATMRADCTLDERIRHLDSQLDFDPPPDDSPGAAAQKSSLPEAYLCDAMGLTPDEAEAVAKLCRRGRARLNGNDPKTEDPFETMIDKVNVIKK